METNHGHGHLVIIGGHEDRTHDKAVLQRFVELAGGPEKKIVVISAASGVAEKMWAIYDQAFADLGVARRAHLRIESREDANADTVLRELADAGGIFMTGGDQKRLMANIGGTAFDRELHAAYLKRGVCIGGTSAGASAMSGHMLATGHAGTTPEKGAVNLGAGLGLVRGVVIDQHFSERHRLSRLLTVVAQNPYLQGAGIDEDTALVIERGVGIEVIGQGAVTIVDGRTMHSNMASAASGECPRLVDVRLHLLPTGTRYALSGPGEDGDVPAALRDFINTVTKRIDYHENH
ncbi:cyanophycinase [Duganella aceris]|uniref:Cyanophycinase n=1 Tax=Duganella aceris TaxID=2703883 RepID=A0ABX0FP30_9BURK|nr:cyanophycinase [Duganella aceris]NGZ86242.1 cyanophycinase [Duganella aceris]